jgi:hypothetical protein
MNEHSFVVETPFAVHEEYIGPPPAPAEPPKKKLLTTIALTIDTCRWPFGDPVAADFHYCGEPPLMDGPYCEVHHSKSYQPVRSRRAAA